MKPFGVRLRKFLAKLNLEDFCSFFADYYNDEIADGGGDKYEYENFTGDTPAEVALSLYKSAKKNEDLKYVLIYLVLYWVEEAEGNPLELFKAGFCHDLKRIYDRCLDSDIPQIARLVTRVLKKIPFIVYRYVNINVSRTMEADRVFEYDARFNIIPPAEEYKGQFSHCRVPLNFDVTAGNIVWRNKVDVRLEIHNPACRVISTRTVNVLLTEPQDQLVYAAFRFMSYFVGDVLLEFTVSRDGTVIDRKYREFRIEPPDPDEIKNYIFLVMLYNLFEFSSQAPKDTGDLDIDRLAASPALDDVLEKIETFISPYKKQYTILSTIIYTQKQEILRLREEVDRYKRYSEELEYKLNAQAEVTDRLWQLNREKEEYIEELVKEKQVLLEAIDQKTKPARFDAQALKSKLNNIVLGMFTAFLHMIGEGMLATTARIPAQFMNFGKTKSHAELHADSNEQPPYLNFIPALAANRTLGLGIDFGTTSISLAFANGVQRKNTPRAKYSTLFDKENRCSIPVAFAVDNKGKEHIGDTALQKINGGSAWITSIKRYIGENVKFPFGKYSLRPEDISGKILRYLKQHAEHLFGEIETTVISIPAHFNEIQKEKTEIAAKKAGFEWIEFVDDPVAAALYYPGNGKPQRKILTYDLGGGTFETALLSHKKNQMPKIDAFDWDQKISGSKIDEYLAGWITQQMLERGIKWDVEPGSPGFEKMLALAEKIKIFLSRNDAVNLDDISTGIIDRFGVPVVFDFNITLGDLTCLVKKEVEKTIKMCRDLLERSEVSPRELDEVILIGGGAYLPLVSKRLQTEFPCKIRTEAPAGCVAGGAAIMSGQIPVSSTTPYLNYIN